MAFLQEFFFSPMMRIARFREERIYHLQPDDTSIVFGLLDQSRVYRNVRECCIRYPSRQRTASIAYLEARSAQTAEKSRNMPVKARIQPASVSSVRVASS